jgi:hypothetical protein
VAGYVNQAAAFANERLCLPAIPSRLQMTGFTAYYDSRYYNAALSGRLMAGPIGETIHDEPIAGVTFTDNFTPEEQDYLVQNGVSPAKSSGGVVRNVMCNTTDTTSALTEDMGVQDIKDYTRQAWRDKMWDLFRNKPITVDLPDAIEGASRNFLGTLVGKTIIADFDRVTAAQDPSEPRKINLSARIQPVYGMAYMDITFTFVLSFAA